MSIFLGLGAVIVGFFMAVIGLALPIIAVKSGTDGASGTAVTVVLLLCIVALLHTAFTLFQYAVGVL